MIQVKGWYQENCVFVWTLLIAIGVIIYGVVYSSALAEISGIDIHRVSEGFHIK